MFNFFEFDDEVVRAVDPLTGGTITSAQVPEYIENEPAFRKGIDYLKGNAHLTAVSLYLISHVTANDLGLHFEEEVNQADVIALEDNGWTIEELIRLRTLASGGTIEEYLRSRGNNLASAGWTNLVLDDSTYASRLIRAVHGSGKNICIADRKEEGEDRYSDGLARFATSTEKHLDKGTKFAAPMFEAFSAHREWHMVANLGVHLAETVPNPEHRYKILFPVGARHFMLFDKFVTLGIVPDVQAISGVHVATDEDNSVFRNFYALTNVGRVALPAKW